MAAMLRFSHSGSVKYHAAVMKHHAAVMKCYVATMKHHAAVMKCYVAIMNPYRRSCDHTLRQCSTDFAKLSSQRQQLQLF